MTQIVRIICFLTSLFLSYQVVAFNDYSVTLINISSSGRTIYLDRGRFEDVGKDDFAFLVQKVPISNDKYIYRPVAKLKVIKLFDRESTWIAYKIFYPSALVKQSKLFLLSESALLKGRRELKISRMDIVTNGDVKGDLNDLLLEGDRIAYKNKDYKIIDSPHKKQRHFEDDIELIDINEYKSKLGDDKLYVSGIYRSPHAKEFADRRRYRTFEKIVMAYLKKYNDPTFDKAKFLSKYDYRLNQYVSTHSAFAGAKEKYANKMANEAAKDEEFYQKLKKKGERWSEDYSDQELSRILNRMSVIREKQRRSNMISLDFSYQGYLGMGINLLNNENLNDSQTSQPSRVDVELGLEGYPFDNLRESERFMLEISMRRALDGFYGGNLNITSEEYSVAGHINWYPFNKPGTMEENILFLGLHMRFGFARLSNATFDEVGNYQVFSFPGLRGGIKYNLKNGYGVRITTAYENIVVDRLAKTTDEFGALPDRANYIEAKIAMSLSKFF